jgi:hypothetical protein
MSDYGYDEIAAIIGKSEGNADFPQWNSAVATVRKSSPAENGVGSTYLMERALPTGRSRVSRSAP